MKTLKIFNFTWGFIFLMINIVYVMVYTHDGVINKPVTIQKYVDAGGSKIDYFIGYLFVAPCDTEPNSIRSEKFLQILGFTLLWFVGATILSKLETKIEPKVKFNHLLLIPQMFIITTTVMSLYGMYYVYIYIAKGFYLLV